MVGVDIGLLADLGATQAVIVPFVGVVPRPAAAFGVVFYLEDIAHAVVSVALGVVPPGQVVAGMVLLEEGQVIPIVCGAKAGLSDVLFPFGFNQLVEGVIGVLRAGLYFVVAEEDGGDAAVFNLSDVAGGVVGVLQVLEKPPLSPPPKEGKLPGEGGGRFFYRIGIWF